MDLTTLKARLAERTKQFDQAMGQANFLAGQVRELEALIAEMEKPPELETTPKRDLLRGGRISVTPELGGEEAA